MKFRQILAVAAMALGMYCTYAANIPSGADLATMYDYFYYRDSGTTTRAMHALNNSGEYTLSADKVWSALYVGVELAEPAILNLCGRTLTVNGCDSNQARPLVGHNNTTLVISNGTFKTVYDPEAYPWTSTSVEEKYYSQRRGIFLSRNSDSAVGSRLIVANGGKLILDGGDAKVAWKGGGHSLIVESGGEFDGQLGFSSGNDNRYVFKNGSAFTKISRYVSKSGEFPVGFAFRSVTNNVVEICDQKILADAGVSALTPDAGGNTTSFRSGLCLRGSDIAITNSIANFSCGKDTAALLELRDGAKLWVSNAVMLGTRPTGSGAMMLVDGVGSAVRFLLPSALYAGYVGMQTNTTDVVLRLSNGATVDALGKYFSVGSAAGSNSNLIEVLSGSHFAASPLNIGSSSNYCNRVVVSGEGSTMTNSHNWLCS